MARYAAPAVYQKITTTPVTIQAPAQGIYTELAAGSAAVTVPNPVTFYGTVLTYYNSSLSDVVLTTPSGTFTGSSATTLTVKSLQTLQIIGDGANYTVLVGTGGPSTLTSATIGLVSYSTAATISTAGTQTMTITAGGSLALSSANVAYNVTVPYPNLGVATTPNAAAPKRYVDSLLTTATYWARSW
jgi:hypothetical protein